MDRKDGTEKWQGKERKDDFPAKREGVREMYTSVKKVIKGNLVTVPFGLFQKEKGRKER